MSSVDKSPGRTHGQWKGPEVGAYQVWLLHSFMQEMKSSREGAHFLGKEFACTSLAGRVTGSHPSFSGSLLVPENGWKGATVGG